MLEKLFIIIHTKHPKLGNLLLPYLASQEQQFLNNLERIVADDTTSLEELTAALADHEQEIVRISEHYSHRELAQRFGKPGETAVCFISRLEPDYIQRHIRPYIEKRITEIFTLIHQHGLPIYPYNRHASLYLKDATYPFKNPATIVFKFIKTEEHIIYRQMIRVDEIPIIITGLKPVFISEDPCRLLIGRHIFWFNEAIDAAKFLPFYTKEEVIIPLRTERIWFEKFLVKIAGRFQIETEGFDLEEIRSEPRPKLFLENNWQGLPCIRLAFYYGKIRVYHSSEETVFSQLITTAGGSSVARVYRNIEAEERFISILKNLGLRETAPNHFGVVKPKTDLIEKETGMYITWASVYVSELKKEGFGIDQSGYRNNYYIGKFNISTNWGMHNDWFSIHLVIQFSHCEIPFIWLQKHILEKTREYVLPDGFIFIIPEAWFSQYEDLFQYGKIVDERIRMSKHHAPLLKSIPEIPTDVDKLIRQVIGESIQETPIPAGLKCQLRDYQVEGFRWMVHLRDLGLNGCLADDMGLGKTIQTIALLCAIAEGSETENNCLGAADFSATTERPPARNRETTKTITQDTDHYAPGQQLSLFDMPAEPTLPASERIVNHITTLQKNTSLLVAPVTLLYNWRAELKRFAPHLKVVLYIGSQRNKLIYKLKDADVVLCSYGVVRADGTILSKHPFHYLILDESQLAKNPTSKTYRALLTLQSDHRLALSGTPVENSLMDMYALMHLLNRGMLGTRRSFMQEFLNPIRREPEGIIGKEAINKLKSLTRPFLMRRTKEQVANELPPKTEQLILCNMTPEQERIYEEELSKVRNYILSQVNESSMAKSTAYIISGLSRLRQLACHPAMVFPDQESAGSGKLTQVMEKLRGLLQEKHKVLVISSYKKHLRFVETELKQESVPYALLTGDTTDHESVVERFKHDSSVRIMLMTLKKGGYGLNLTEADYVLILDPWWNPAAQQQGADRVHRIGQNKPVFVYKFITLNTVEEKIRRLQKDKKRTADTIIGVNNPLSDLTKERLSELLTGRH